MDRVKKKFFELKKRSLSIVRESNRQEKLKNSKHETDNSVDY